MINKILALLVIFISLSMYSCRVQNRMFKADGEMKVDSIQGQIKNAEKNYIIQPDDYLFLDVYTNSGERIVDPNSELVAAGQQVKSDRPRYLVRRDGFVRLPMVGDINLQGKTLYQADSLLEQEFMKFYESPFVITKLANKRAIVIGPIGGKVLLLEHENVNLIELIALYGGMENGKSYNIRLIRGDLKNPDVSIIDLSTIEGMKRANLLIEPNDIVYIEPIRKIGDTVREISPFISLITTVVTLIVLISSRTN